MIALSASRPRKAIPVFEPGSFRDRGSRVFLHEGNVFRALSAGALADWHELSATRFFIEEMRAGRIVSSVGVEEGGDDFAPDWRMYGPYGAPWAAVLRHERIPFISYPYEWCFSMLRETALLHLDLMASALQEGFILKDASPYNVQWRGTAPVFIDVGSFTRHPPGQPWLAYRQFCQMFLYPLLLAAYRGIDFQPWLRGALDGITPAQFARQLSVRDLFRRGVLTHGWLHARLEQGLGAERAPTSASLQAHGFQTELILANVRKLRGLILRLSPPAPRSAWTGYRTDADSARSDGDAKAQFVSEVVYSRTWPLVWDLGCNTGRFSQIAAENATSVVAIDADAGCEEQLYRALRREGVSRILPLVSNLADPSPALGWRGTERHTLEERGRPDLVLCLALIHHLVIGANVLLDELLDWLASLGGHLVIEYVDKQDPMVRALLRNKSDQYTDYSREAFERGLSARFDVRRQEALPSGTRALYYAVPRSSPDPRP
jgi:SAM-dependent methyltransferase